MRQRVALRYLLALGLLLLSTNSLLRHLLPISNWAVGFLAGTGLGIELLALYWITRLRAPRC